MTLFEIIFQSSSLNSLKNRITPSNGDDNSNIIEMSTINRIISNTDNNTNAIINPILDITNSNNSNNSMKHHSIDTTLVNRITLSDDQMNIHNSYRRHTTT
jgi:hypothetical protein